MKKSLLSLLALSGIFFSCSKNVDLAIDNPTNESLVVSIDSLVVEVPPREVVWVEMGKGEHSITLDNDSLVKFNFTDEAYMLNPSLTEYLMYEEFYGSEAYMSSHVSAIPNQTIHYLGMDIEGNYAIVKDLVNPVTWDYGPREVLPEMVELDSDEQFTALTKIADPIEIISQMAASQSSDEEIQMEEPIVDEIDSTFVD